MRSSFVLDVEVLMWSVLKALMNVSIVDSNGAFADA